MGFTFELSIGGEIGAEGMGFLRRERGQCVFPSDANHMAKKAERKKGNEHKKSGEDSKKNKNPIGEVKGGSLKPVSVVGRMGKTGQ